MFYVINNCYGGFSVNARTAKTLNIGEYDDDILSALTQS